MGNFGLVVEEATKFLREAGASSREKSKPGPIIVDALEKIEAITLSRGSLFGYLSNAANDPSKSQIVSKGPKSGYWLEDRVDKNTKEKPDTIEIEVDKKKKKLAEKDLYPLIELWLATKEFRSKDVSQKKSGGRWGNPDIVGLKRVEAFGISDVEIATCEVKLSLSDWERVIFEAISHKRFANKSYFCYRSSGEDEGIDHPIGFYAEKFRVGIVRIALSDDDFNKVSEAGNDFKKLENYLENIDVVFPAMYDVVAPQEKSILLERLDIKDERAFYNFGRTY